MGKIGLVFAGGGGKGAYQVGVWKALKEYGIDKNISAISGTSIGALNSVLFLQGDYNLAEDVWVNISQDRMLPVDKKLILRNFICVELSMRKTENILQWAEKLEENGTVTREGLIKIVEECMNYDVLLKSSTPCYATCCLVPDIEAEYFKLNDYDEEHIKSILFATTSIPLVFDKVLIDGKYYMDGGIKDNIPIKPVYDEKCDTIIVVYFNRKNRVDKSLYPGANIVEILPSREQGGWISGTLDFSQYGAIERIIQGYKDTIAVFQGVFDDYKEYMDMEEHIRNKKELIYTNLEEIMVQDLSLKEGIDKIRHIKVVNDNLKKVGKVNKKKGISY